MQTTFGLSTCFHPTLSRMQTVLMAQLNRIHIIFIVSYFEKTDVRSNFIEHMWFNLLYTGHVCVAAWQKGPKVRNMKE